MAILRLDESPFSSGRARFADTLPEFPDRASIYIRVAVEGMEEPFLALVDTGAEYSVLAQEIAQEVGLDVAAGQEIVLSHRGGRTAGKLVRTTVRMHQGRP